MSMARGICREPWKSGRRTGMRMMAPFRSEVGVPGAVSVELIRRYCNDESLPCDLSHPAWRHVAGWWIQWPEYLKQCGCN